MESKTEPISRPISLNSVAGVVIVPGEPMAMIQPLQRCREYNIRTAIIMKNGERGSSLPEEVEKLAEKTYPYSGNGRKEEVQEVLRRVIHDLGIRMKSTVLISADWRILDLAGDLQMAMKIGIRGNQQSRRDHYEAGAHLVVDSMNDILFSGGDLPAPEFTQDIPNLFSSMTKFRPQFRNKKPVFFFDYDGTLTPIVKDPEKAILPTSTRTLLQKLAEKSTVAVISGRDMHDIHQFVHLEKVIYAGSHGFRISGPGGMYMEHQKAKELIPRLNELENILRSTLEKEIPGVQVERKHFAIAVHYRNAPPKTYRSVHQHVDDLIASEQNFTKGSGKKIVEIKPKLDWHKGKAVEWILDFNGMSDRNRYLPVYVGDDVTDEDAFRTLADDGIGILVGEHSLPSAAHFHLENVEEVNKFLHFLVHSMVSG